jgi:UDP-N-acetyl-2-amino-2-deoxyglucuronate dehydrogenase
MWLFGNVKTNHLFLRDDLRSAGFIELERAEVKWFLSIDKKNLPHEAVEQGKLTYRSITIDNEEIEFNEGFTNLHTRVYEEILHGKGHGIEDARPSIEAAYDIRHLPIVKIEELYHPILLK